jgi:hypothetical protein
VRVFAAGVIGFFMAMIDRGMSDAEDAGPIEASESGLTFLRAGLAALRARVGR